jgi:uncharacterized integral membrane protein
LEIKKKEGRDVTRIIFILCIIAILAIFSIQNAVPIEISFLLWSFKASLAIVLFLSALGGMIAGIVASFLFRTKTSKKKPDQMLRESSQR